MNRKFGAEIPPLGTMTKRAEEESGQRFREGRYNGT